MRPRATEGGLTPLCHLPLHIKQNTVQPCWTHVSSCFPHRFANIAVPLRHLLRYESKVPGQCSPGDGTPLVVYKNLVADIEAVFTVDALEKMPATTKVWEVRG